MNRNIWKCIFIIALALPSGIHAQSLKDLLNKENIEKVVNAVTNNSNIDMTGTWTFTGSALELESDNLLQQAGGTLASSALEKKLDEQLNKIGIKPGQLSFTFNADSTLLFDADKLLQLLTYLSSKSSNSTLQTLGNLAGTYDGMLLGLGLKKANN